MTVREYVWKQIKAHLKEVNQDKPPGKTISMTTFVTDACELKLKDDRAISEMEKANKNLEVLSQT